MTLETRIWPWSIKLPLLKRSSGHHAVVKPPEET
jgi:hypothetical protein